MSRLTANLGLLLAAAIWGGGFIAQSTGAAHLSGAWLTGLRYILAFLAVLPLGLIEARRTKAVLSRAHRLWLLPLGLVFFAGTILQQWAIEITSVTHVGFLTGLYVIFVPILEMLLLRRLPHPAIGLAAIVALTGTWCLGGNLSSLSTGDLLTIASAVCFAVQIVMLDRFVHITHRPVLAALAQSLACAVLGCMIGVFTDALTVSSLRGAAISIAYAGILSGGLAFLLQAVCQRYTRATDAAVMLMSESLFAALLAALLLGERMPVRGWVGCGLLVASLLLAQFGPAVILRARKMTTA
jgi:drug/metabolite transporter (DMT)-like permease